MAEALGLAASIIAIATLAYDSSKRLFELLDGIQKAPKAISDLKTDTGALQQLLKSLSSEIEGADDASLPERFKKYLEELKPSLTGCSDACTQFEEKISKITSHSDEKHTSFRDLVKLQFQEKEILTFRYRLASYKATLNIALTMAHFKSTSQSAEATQKLENVIESTMISLSGQIQGLEIGMQAVAEFGEQKEELMQALAEHNNALGQCLKACMAALSETTAKTGNTFKYARAFDDAKMLIGTIGNVVQGGPSNLIEVAIAQDRSKMIAGSIDGATALAFMNEPSARGSKRGAASSSLELPPMPH